MVKKSFWVELLAISIVFVSMVGCKEDEPKRTARDDIIQLTQKTKPQIKAAPVISDVHYSAHPALLKNE